MELKEAMQMAAWAFLGLTIAYAHFQMRKLRKVIFNDLQHLMQQNQSPIASRQSWE
jgi:hypothetical protein